MVYLLGKQAQDSITVLIYSIITLLDMLNISVDLYGKAEWNIQIKDLPVEVRTDNGTSRVISLRGDRVNDPAGGGREEAN